MEGGRSPLLLSPVKLIRRALTATCLFAIAVAGLGAAGAPEIVSVKRIWDEAPHNAFTDLIRFHRRWYCTFREADGHVKGDGKLRVLESGDGDNWQSAAVLA